LYSEVTVHTWLFFLIIVVAVGILAILKSKQTTKDETLGFETRDLLFTAAERSFLGVMEQALDSQYRIFGKVRLGDIVKPAKGLTPSKRTTASNRINQKHVDFVICSATDLELLGVVELDDQSHGREDRAKRDEFIDQALAGAKIPVVHFSAKKGYTLPDVRAKLAELLGNNSVTAMSDLNQGNPVVERPAPVQMEGVMPSTEQVASNPITPEGAAQEPTAPVCPKCSSAMVKRQASKGSHTGKFFWACSAFPKCRQVMEIREN
jgi:hypothetical protein